MTNLYFAYGMNLDPEAMPGFTPVGKARLYGWRLEFVGVAIVVPAEEHEYVEGVVWEVTDQQLRTLDIREGYPHMYGREVATVRMPFDEEAIVYVPAGEWTQDRYPPGIGYLSMIEAGYRRFDLDCSTLRLALDRAEDDVQRRHDEAWS